MPVVKRGLVAPQNTFLENVIRRCNNSGMFSVLYHSKNCRQTMCEEIFLKTKLSLLESKLKIIRYCGFRIIYKESSKNVSATATERNHQPFDVKLLITRCY